VVAIADPDQNCLDRLTHQFQLDPTIQLTTDAVTVLSQFGVEAVAIATPATTHYSLIRAALQQGLHVLAEKPLTLKSQEAWELCRLAVQQQRQLVVDHTYLFHPAVQRGKQVLRTGTLGALRYGYATRTHLGPVRSDVDVLWDLAIHDIAIFNHWLHDTPMQVQAEGTGWLQPHLQETHLARSDLVWLKLLYPSGFQATIHLCWANSDKQRRLCLVGQAGTLIFDELRSAAMLTLQQGRFTFDNGHLQPTCLQTEILDLEKTEPLQQLCSHFITCAQQNAPSPTSAGELGAELVEILTALTRSLEQGGGWVPVALTRSRSVPPKI
jgi:predicted dehydrogenase